MSEVLEEITLVDSLGCEWLKLPLAVMRDAGPAVQTLGGLLKVTSKQTFSAVSAIAGKARLPVATVRKQLITLDRQGWIRNHGRQETPAGYPRRTATIAITGKAKAILGTYGILPWWACCTIRNIGTICNNSRLPWCAKALLSIIMARLASLAAAVERQDGNGLDASDLEDSIENMGGDDRFRFSLEFLENQTGLTRHSIVRAKALLNHRYGIIKWSEEGWTPGTATPVDYLVPNWAFRVIETPTSPGKCYLDFQVG
jgi:hypothetical protein